MKCLVRSCFFQLRNMAKIRHLLYFSLNILRSSMFFMTQYIQPTLIFFCITVTDCSYIHLELMPNIHSVIGNQKMAFSKITICYNIIFKLLAVNSVSNNIVLIKLKLGNWADDQIDLKKILTSEEIHSVMSVHYLRSCSQEVVSLDLHKVCKQGETLN